MSYKTTLKSNILSVELKKKNVKITCYNNKSGNAVMSAISQNASALGLVGHDIKKGLTAKDFKVEFKKKESAETFYDNVMAIVEDSSVSTEAPVESGLAGIQQQLSNVLQGQGQEPAPAPAGDGGDDSNNTALIIGGVVLFVLVIGLLIWKMKK